MLPFRYSVLSAFAGLKRKVKIMHTLIDLYRKILLAHARSLGWVFLSVICVSILMLTGCTDGHTDEPAGTPPVATSTKPPELPPTDPAVTDVKFSLPEGWEWGEDGSAVLRSKNPPSDKLINKIEFMGLEDWTEAQAKQWVWEDYQDHKSGCDYSANHGHPEDCEFQPEYKELTIDGMKIYASMDVNSAWGTPDWGSLIAFYKNGEVVRFSMLSRADESTKEIYRLINSITWKSLKK